MSQKKILIVCPYPKNVAPSQRLKFEQYYESWKQAGYDITIDSFQSLRFWNIIYQNGSLLSKVWHTFLGYFSRFLRLFTLRKFDIVYIHLWVTPFGPPIYEWLYCCISKKVIFDIDDLVFLGKSSDMNSWVSKLKGKGKPIYLMKHADHIITCTPYLDNFVRQYNQHTTDISSTINTDNYSIVNTYQNDHKIILGWSGSHSTAKYLYLLHPMLLKLKKQHDFKLLVMGAGAHFQMQDLDVELVPWTEENEIKTIQRFDIGLYPLPDEQWVHGKSGLKALQYMAMGLPTVASKIGEAIERVIKDGESGFLVSGYDKEWIEALSMLITDSITRKNVGQTSRKRVEEMYSIQATKPIYLSVLNEVINSKK